MDCSNTLEMLDCVRPNSGDLDLPDFVDARTHLDQCDRCRCEFESRQQFDRAVATVVQDVAVPEALPQAVLNALAAETAGAVHEESSDFAETWPESDSVRLSRRSRWRTGLSFAALLSTAAIALVVTYWPRSPDQFPVESLLVRVVADPAQVVLLETFAGEPAPTHPAGFRHPSLGWDSRFYGKDLDGDSSHDIAITRFEFHSRAHGRLTGVIVEIPASRVTELPATTDFSRSSVLYPSPGGFDAAAVTWTDGTTVYLCFVPRRQAAALGHLQSELRGTTA